MHRIGPFAGLQQFSQQPSNNDFTVVGTRILVLEDKNAHEAVENCLVPWFGDASNLMDRYDARLLLDSLDTLDKYDEQRHARPAAAEAEVSAEELDAERYADLDYSKEHLVCASGINLHNETGYEDSGSQHEQLLAPGADHHQGPAFYFDYSNSRQQQQQTTESRSADTQARVSVMGDGSTVKAAQGLTAQEYHPPYKQLPACLEGHLPLNKRQHETIVRTAEFVRSNGNQVEVLLRVKHGDNPNFAFLISLDRLHPYYRWLVEENPQQSDEQQPPGEQNSLQAVPVQQQPLRQALEAASGVARNDLGALALLQAYSMNSEAESEDLCEQQQQSSVRQQPEGDTVNAAFGDAQEQQQVSHGPALPPAVPQDDAAALASKAGAPGTPEHAMANTSTGDKAAMPGGTQPQQQQEQSAADVAPAMLAAEPAGAAGGGVKTPAAPPERVKAIIDKLVVFVRKNGIDFEAVVRAREAHNLNFEFMNPGCLYHDYYLHQLEAAMGSGPVQQLFQASLQQQPAAASHVSAQQQVAGSGSAAETAQPPANISPQQGALPGSAKVVLKANPRLAIKRAPTVSATVCGEFNDKQVLNQLDVRCERVAPGDAAASTADVGTEALVPAAEGEQHLHAGSEGSAEPQLVQQNSSKSAEATGVTTAATAGTANDPAAMQAEKRLKLQMYLRQKRAEQLAEQQQQEHEAKARAILAHRLLLKRLKSGIDSGPDSSTAAADGSDHGAATTDQQQSMDVEEGEIAATQVEAAAAVAAAGRREAEQLLKGPPEPVSTALPGLKELAVSAAAAAAQHRAALLVGSDNDDDEADGGEQHAAAKQKEIIQVALKAAREAAAAGGASALSSAGVTATVPDAVAPSAPAPITSMAAAANAAAAVIASQASPGAAALAQQQQEQHSVLQPDTAAAVAAAAAHAAAAAAALSSSKNKQTVLQLQCTQPVAVRQHSRSSSSNSSSRESSGQQQLPAKRRRRSRSRSRSRNRRRSSSSRNGLRRGDASQHKHSCDDKRSRHHSERRKHSSSKSSSRHRDNSRQSRLRSRSRECSHEDGKNAKSWKRHRHRSRDSSRDGAESDEAKSDSQGSGSDIRNDPRSRCNGAADTLLLAAGDVPSHPSVGAADTAPGLQLLDRDKLRLRLRQMMGSVGK